MKQRDRGILLAGLGALLVIGMSGCASKGYVNDRIDQAIGETRGDIDGLKRETAELRNSNAEAMARAASASDAATEARDLALGRAGLEELNSYAVYFKFNSDELTDEAAATLQQAAGQIREHPEAIVDVYGFADPTGPDRYNLELGQRRAMEVVRYLAGEAPIGLGRYAAVSYGERPLRGRAPDATGNARQRRVVVSLIRRIPLDEVRPAEAAQALERR